MLALRFQHLAIRAESGQNGCGLPAGDAGQRGLDLFEMAGCIGLAGGGLGELVEGVQRSGSLGLEQGIEDRLDLAQAMNLKAAHFEDGHPGKGAHLGSVTGDEPYHGFANRGFFVA